MPGKGDGGIAVLPHELGDGNGVAGLAGLIQLNTLQQSPPPLSLASSAAGAPTAEANKAGPGWRDRRRGRRERRVEVGERRREGRWWWLLPRLRMQRWSPPSASLLAPLGGTKLVVGMGTRAGAWD